MGGPITNELNPVQKTRSKYACIILEASTAQFETMNHFLENGGKVLIDSIFSFEVSPARYVPRCIQERLSGFFGLVGRSKGL